MVKQRKRSRPPEPTPEQIAATEKFIAEFQEQSRLRSNLLRQAYGLPEDDCGGGFIAWPSKAQNFSLSASGAEDSVSINIGLLTNQQAVTILQFIRTLVGDDNDAKVTGD